MLVPVSVNSKFPEPLLTVTISDPSSDPQVAGVGVMEQVKSFISSINVAQVVEQSVLVLI